MGALFSLTPGLKKNDIVFTKNKTLVSETNIGLQSQEDMELGS